MKGLFEFTMLTDRKLFGLKVISVHHLLQLYWRWKIDIFCIQNFTYIFAKAIIALGALVAFHNAALPLFYVNI